MASTRKALSVMQRQLVSDIIKSELSTNFQSSFPGATDMHNIVLALVARESSFSNEHAVNSGSTDKNFVSSSIYKSISSSGTPTQKANMSNASRYVYGAMQVRGSYLISKGNPSGVCEIERIRPDLSSSVCISAGEDPASYFLGNVNLLRSIRAGLIILEGKYKAVPGIMKQTGYGYSYRNLLFSSQIEAAIGSYLGLGSSDIFSTTPTQYAKDIVGGPFYVIANGPITPRSQQYDPRGAAKLAAGPVTNSSSMDKVSVVGC